MTASVLAPCLLPCMPPLQYSRSSFFALVATADGGPVCVPPRPRQRNRAIRCRRASAQDSIPSSRPLTKTDALPDYYGTNNTIQHRHVVQSGEQPPSAAPLCAHAPHERPPPFFATTTARSNVNSIISATVLALEENPDRKFIEVEQAFFQRWWAEQSAEKQASVRALVASGQLEFINGGWSMQ